MHAVNNNFNNKLITVNLFVMLIVDIKMFVDQTKVQHDA